MHRPATTAVLVAMTLLGAACSPQTTTTTTATTAPPATTTTTVVSTTKAAPTAVLALSDQTVGSLQVTIDSFEANVPVQLVVGDENGPAGVTDMFDPGTHSQVSVTLGREPWEPDVLTPDTPAVLTVTAQTEDGTTLASGTMTVTLHIPTVDYTVPQPPDPDSESTTTSQEQHLISTEGAATAQQFVQKIIDDRHAYYIATPESMAIPEGLAVDGAARDFFQVTSARILVERICADTDALPTCIYAKSLPKVTYAGEAMHPELMNGHEVGVHGVVDSSDMVITNVAPHRWVLSVLYDSVLYGYPRHFIFDIRDGHPVLIDVAFQKVNAFTSDSYTVGELAPPPSTLTFVPSAGTQVSCSVVTTTGVLKLARYSLLYLVSCVNNGSETTVVPYSIYTVGDTSVIAPLTITPSAYDQDTVFMLTTTEKKMAPGESSLIFVGVSLPSLQAREKVSIQLDLFPNRPEPVDVGSFVYAPSSVPACYLCDFTPVPES